MRSPLIRVTATAVACAMLLSGCKDDEQQSSALEKNSSSSSRDNKDTNSRSKNTSKDDVRDSRDSDDRDRDGLREVYREILKNPTTVSPNFKSDDRKPSGKYSYTLADVDGDGLPEMLLSIGSKVNEWDDMSVAAVIMGTSTPKHVVIDKHRFYHGAASAGGARVELYIPAPGHTGLTDVYGRSVVPDVKITKYEVSHGKLTKTQEYKDNMQGLSIPGACHPDWLPVSDGSLVDTLSAQQCRPETETTPPSSHRADTRGSDEGTKKKEDEDLVQSSNSLATTTNVGPQKLRGTVRTYKGYELNSTPAYGEDPNISYRVLDFDNLPALTCKSTYHYRTDKYKRLYLGESDQWAKYDGKHVTLTVTPDQCWYPSQADMPIGIARLSAGPSDLLQ